MERKGGVKIIRGTKQMQDFSRKIRKEGRSIGFVPTMGALHEGHLSLIRRARKDNNIVVVSIFVNPAQFGPGEDFKKYSRNLKADADLCRKAGVDIIFYPAVKAIYPLDHRTYVEVQGLSNVLCGKFRPGHFLGVATVVAKLLNILQPDIAYFGGKDAQQAIIIKKMALDLNLPLKIKVLPTLREKSGLALSSRNKYLSQVEKRDAAILYQALTLARKLIQPGQSSPAYILRQMHKIIARRKNIKVQYISIVDPNNLRPVEKVKGRVLIALAASVGKTRLIDNIIVNS